MLEEVLNWTDQSSIKALYLLEKLEFRFLSLSVIIIA